MPLFEFECKKCRGNVETVLKTLEKQTDKITVKDLLKKYENIHSIEVFDLDKDKLLAKRGKAKKDKIVKDYYINDGTVLVLVNIDNYRFQELIYDKDDEKKLTCTCGRGEKDIEKVISSFSFTSDLSTNMPKPDLSNLPPSVRAKTKLTEYIEEKDRPKANR